MHRTSTFVIALVGVFAVLAFLVQPAAAAEVQTRRWAVSSQSYYHYGNRLFGETRSDTWVDEQFQETDLGTEPYLFWRVRATSRVVKVSRARCGSRWRSPASRMCTGTCWRAMPAR
jgi:hypothetical protein